MKKLLVPVLLIFGIAVTTLGLITTSASLNDTQTSHVSLSSAVLNFMLNGDNTNSLELDLGEIKPGDSGVVAITVNNVGNLPGNLCIEGGNLSLGLEIKQNELCNTAIGQGESIVYEIKWSLPLSAHNTALNGMDFEFSYEFVFDNGYVVVKQVVIKGRIVDPADTPTSTETVIEIQVPTFTPTPTATEEVDIPVPIDTPTSTPSLTQTVTDTLEPMPTETPIPTETPVPADTETPIPTDTETSVPTETETPIPTDTETSVPTEIPTEVVP